jgi:hypothetical protein
MVALLFSCPVPGACRLQNPDQEDDQQNNCEGSGSDKHGPFLSSSGR